MSLWTSFVKSAMLGTQRGRLPAITAVSPLTSLLHQIDTSDAEAALLTMVGLIDLHEQAGHLPGKIPPLPTYSLVNERPEPPPHITHRMGLILNGKYGDLLPEFLAALNRASFRAPTLYLPNLLDKGAKVMTLRPLLLPILDQPGRWLAAQNPAWAYALLRDAPWQQISRIWQQTLPTKRYALLHQLRQDHPAKARQLLESTWRSESDTVRGQLIKLLHINITMADEPFLERALDDRNHLVRSKAAELLAKLPQSRLAARMLEHTRDLLVWVPDHPISLRINFPPITKAMMRDGILHRETAQKTRLRSRQLIQMITAVPLTHWTTKWSVTPEEIVAKLPRTYWPNTLISAFTAAARQQQNAAWAAALLKQSGVRDQTAMLVSILPDAEAAEIIKEVIEPIYHAAALSRTGSARIILGKWDRPWPENLGLIWLQLFAKILSQPAKDKHTDPMMNTIFRKFAKLCPPTLADDAARLLKASRIGTGWRTPTQNLVDTLTFRQAMIEEMETAAHTQSNPHFPDNK